MEGEETIKRDQLRNAVNHHVTLRGLRKYKKHSMGFICGHNNTYQKYRWSEGQGGEKWANSWGT